MKSIWNEHFEIKSFNVDFKQELKPSALMQFFQEVASNHAAELGAGYEVLIQRGLFWALSRLTVEITRMPSWGEKIQFETWPCGYEGLLFRRDFLVFDQQGEVIIRGVSGWLLVDGTTMRPQRPSALMLDLPAHVGRRAMNQFPGRIATQASDLAYRRRVAYNEIDQNLHVNNTRYLDWATDCFEHEHYKKYSCSAFALEYLAETHWGDEVELRTAIDGDESAIEAVEATTGNGLFRALIKWSPLN